MACVNNRPSDIDVINLVGVDNDVVLTKEDVKIVAPVFTEENERNTTASVEALPAYSHGGQVQIFYDRWDLSKLFNTDMLYIGTVDPAKSSDVICAINAEYGTMLPIDEMDVIVTGGTQIEITAKDSSPSYVGTIRATVSIARIPLSERLTYVNLNGFGNNYPPVDPALLNPVYAYNQNVSGFSSYPQANANAPSNYSDGATLINNSDIAIVTSLCYARGGTGDANMRSLLGPVNSDDRNIVVPQQNGPTGANAAAAYNIAIGAPLGSAMRNGLRADLSKIFGRYRISLKLESRRVPELPWTVVNCENSITSPWGSSYLMIPIIGNPSAISPGNNQFINSNNAYRDLYGDNLSNFQIPFDNAAAFPGLSRTTGVMKRAYGQFRITLTITSKNVEIKPIILVYEGHTDPATV